MDCFHALGSQLSSQLENLHLANETPKSFQTDTTSSQISIAHTLGSTGHISCNNSLAAHPPHSLAQHRTNQQTSLKQWPAQTAVPARSCSTASLLVAVRRQIHDPGAPHMTCT